MTIAFSNTSQKKSNKTILVPNLVFFISIELWIYLNLRVLISNKTIALSNCNLKVSKCDIFDPKIKYFSFTKNFAFLKNSRAPISNTTKVYSQSNSKIYKKFNFAFFFFFWHETFHFDKFERADFKFENSFSKFQSRNSQIRQSLSQM